MASYFIPAPNIENVLDSTKDAKEGKLEAAEAVKETAESMAPYDPASQNTRHYRDQFEVVEEEGEVYLGNKDFKAHWIEWGTQYMQPFGTIRRAVTSAGYKLLEKSRR